MKRVCRNPQSAIRNRACAPQSGFTLIEMLVVIALIALLSLITLSSTNRIGANNRSTTCQANLRSLHQALMMYSADMDGVFPPFNPPLMANNLGLWQIYTADLAGSNLTGYLKNPQRLHCPDDLGPGRPLVMRMPNGLIDLTWSSYQFPDASAGEWSYQTFRPTAPSPANGNFRRQLGFPCKFTPGMTVAPCPANYSPVAPGEATARWEPVDSTVVTWCPFHRDRVKPVGYDNVLFLDGSVQLLQSHLAADPYVVDDSCPSQDAVGPPGARQLMPTAGNLWQRCPRKPGTE